jgi:hypothetical protein
MLDAKLILRRPALHHQRPQLFVTEGLELSESFFGIHSVGAAAIPIYSVHGSNSNASLRSHPFADQLLVGRNDTSLS